MGTLEAGGGVFYRSGAPGRIRTSDRLVRSQVLYPAELRARIYMQERCIMLIQFIHVKLKFSLILNESGKVE